MAYEQRAPTSSGCVARLLRPSTRRDHKDAMTPLVAATPWAMEGLECQSCGMDRRAIFGGCGGPQLPVGKQVVRIPLRQTEVGAEPPTGGSAPKRPATTAPAARLESS